MQTHFMQKNLGGDPPFDDVEMILSCSDAKNALVFTHGYGGDSIDTWSEFNHFVHQRNSFASYDVYFFGYDSIYSDLSASAALFRQFLEAIQNNTANTLANVLPLNTTRTGYEKIKIVAHSLGAVISRRALVDATLANSPWVQDIEQVFFAPAHKGASVVDLFTSRSNALGKFGALFSGLLTFKSPLINQLKSNSAELKQLEDDVKNLTSGSMNQHLIAKEVVIAQYENIVINTRFFGDPPPDTIAKTDHRSVCKPKSGRLEPLNKVESHL